MSDIQDRAKAAAQSPENAAQRHENQRTGVDDDRPAQNAETDATATDHPTGENQAHENEENEPAG